MPIRQHAKDVFHRQAAPPNDGFAGEDGRIRRDTFEEFVLGWRLIRSHQRDLTAMPGERIAASAILSVIALASLAKIGEQVQRLAKTRRAETLDPVGFC